MGLVQARALAERVHMPKEIRDLYDELSCAEDAAERARAALDDADDWVEDVKAQLREKGHDVP